MLVVSEAAARQVVQLRDAIDAVERAFAALHDGAAAVFPVVLGHGLRTTEGWGVKSGVLQSQGVIGAKIGTYWPGNRAKGLESHGSTTLLLDPQTGFPHALVSAAHLTALRTAAADGVAIRYLARPDADTAAVFGAGHQAWFELQAAHIVRPLRRVLVWNRDPGRAEAFAARVREEHGLACEAASAQDAASQADIVITATASHAPLFEGDLIRRGTHVSAMGADAAGKQELDTALLARARLFADVPEQAVTIGEFKTAAREGLIAREAITSIGSVIAGTAPGRRSNQEITVFDSSGMALQDLAVAALALERASAAGLVQSVPLR